MCRVTCDWPIDRTCLPPLPDEDAADYAEKLAQRNNAEDMAVFVLWALSGRRFGVCTATARPCPPLGWPPSRTTWVTDDWLGSVSLGCGCLGHCVRTGPSMVHLPGPVAPPTNEDPVVVVIAGEVLDPAEFTVEGDVLYRRGGKTWPGQNLARPLGEPGTWSVTYRRGVPAPAYTAPLAGQLAREFLAACSGGTCDIPRFLVSTSRQGVTKTFDPAKIIAAGMTGLSDVDQWIGAVNPHRLQQPPEVL